MWPLRRSCVVYVWTLGGRNTTENGFGNSSSVPYRLQQQPTSLSQVFNRAAPHLSLITALKQAFAISSYQLNPFPVAE